jgi:hypothetical protein
MFNDIKWLYGAKLVEWERDLSHLLRVLEVHGMRIPCIDLPAVAKHFDRCLDRGTYNCVTSVLQRPKSAAVRLPKFLGHLYLKIFDNDGKLRSDACIDSIVVIRQIYMGLKKLELPCSEASIQDEIKNFLEIEPQLRRPTNQWDSVLPTWDGELSFLSRVRNRDGRGRFAAEPSQALQKRLRLLHSVCDITAVLLGDLHRESDVGDRELPKHGPGAVSNLRRGEDKYLFPSWSEKLEVVFPYSRYACANEGVLHDDSRDLPWIENSSRLITVPKTLKGPRLIAAEPVENQWVQQLVKRQLEVRIARGPLSSCIRFDSQEENQIKALRGSKDGAFATIDLSSASDRLSCWVVERVFRRNASVLDRLSAVRVTEVGGSLLTQPVKKLRKHSTMGSAVTFPVQTIAYACMAIACVLPLGRRVTIAGIRQASTRVQVFGDDIVVPTHRLHMLKEMLSYLQLKVNEDKTFGGVNFRESCGVDAFRGKNVSPIYAKHVPSERATDGTFASIVQTSNNLHNAGYWRTAALFTRGIEHKRKLVPIYHRTSGHFGLKSFVGSQNSGYTRYNEGLQKFQMKTLMPFKASESIRRDTHASLLQYFIEEPEPDFDWEAVYKKYGRVSLRVGWTDTAVDRMSMAVG